MYNRSIYIFITILLFVTKTSTNAQSIGLSGMEKLNDSSYVVVYDKKNYNSGNRIAILTAKGKSGYKTDEVEVKNWKDLLGKSSDLESVCAVPDTKNEFFIIESSYWMGKYGRIFHIRISGNKAEVLNVYHIPDKKDIDNASGFNFEGSICLKQNNNLYIILGERGGSKKHPEGSLIVGILRDGESSIDWASYKDKIIQVKAPFSDINLKETRSISDLYLNVSGEIFASAAVDKGDNGPFKSIIYKIGIVSFENDNLIITPATDSKPLWTIDGFKIEAISSAPSHFKDAKMSIGTEDENYPGVWRVIY